MPERTSYAPGTPSWVDLATSDVDAAKAFYGTLFGWVTEDVPGDAGGYAMFSKDGKLVAIIHVGDSAVGGMTAMPQGVPDGVPAHWQAYFAVDDADATAAQVEELGGTVAMAPMSAEGVGRFAVLADPQGAQFGVIKNE